MCDGNTLHIRCVSLTCAYCTCNQRMRVSSKQTKKKKKKKIYCTQIHGLSNLIFQKNSKIRDINCNIFFILAQEIIYVESLV